VTPPADDGGSADTEVGYLRRRVAELELRLERRDAEFDRLAGMLEVAVGRVA
jgi:hypothetical protein